MSTIEDQFHHRISRLEDAARKIQVAPTIPKYHLAYHQLVQHYIIVLTQQWDFHIEVNGLTLADGSWFSRGYPGPGYVQDPYVVANGGGSGVNPNFYYYAEDSTFGSEFNAGAFWSFWVKNLFMDTVLLNDMQGSVVYNSQLGALQPTFANFHISTFPGGGKGATTTPGGSNSSVIAEIGGSYTGVNVTHTLECDLSAYNTLQDNVSNQLTFRSINYGTQLQWNPWRGTFATSLYSASIGPGVSWPTNRNTNGPRSWTFDSQSGSFYKIAGANPDGTPILDGPHLTTGSGTSVVLPYTDSTNWYHIKYEITYKGSFIENYPWLQSQG